jgi:beta-glucanase (GH16 family)
MLSRLLRIAAALVVVGAILVPAGPPAGAATPSCGGAVLLKASGQRWRCTFDDEFNGASLNRALWTVQQTSVGGFLAGGACVVDSPRTVSVSNGNLNLTVRRAAAPFACAKPRGSVAATWQAGSVYTKSFGQAYGRFAVRARFPQAHGVAGLQSAIWTFPRDMTMHTAVTGTKEIDIAEAYSRYPDLVSPTVHNFLGGNTGTCDVRNFGGAFHTYAVVWTPATATFYYDGKKCFWAGRTGTSEPFLLALTQGLGVKANGPSAATPSPATMRVAWVRIWK